MKMLAYFVGYLLLANNPVLAWKLARIKMNSQVFKSLYEYSSTTKTSRIEDVDELVHNNRQDDYKAGGLEFINTKKLVVRKFDIPDELVESDVT